MNQWWNDGGRKLKNVERNLLHCHSRFLDLMMVKDKWY
jgi:hypothetical protein